MKHDAFFYVHLDSLFLKLTIEKKKEIYNSSSILVKLLWLIVQLTKYQSEKSLSLFDLAGTRCRETQFCRIGPFDICRKTIFNKYLYTKIDSLK